MRKKYLGVVSVEERFLDEFFHSAPWLWGGSSTACWLDQGSLALL